MIFVIFFSLQSPLLLKVSHCFNVWNLRIEATCLQRPFLFAPRGGRFAQVLLYKNTPETVVMWQKFRPLGLFLLLGGLDAEEAPRAKRSSCYNCLWLILERFFFFFFQFRVQWFFSHHTSDKLPSSVSWLCSSPTCVALWSSVRHSACLTPVNCSCLTAFVGQEANLLMHLQEPPRGDGASSSVNFLLRG